MRRRSIEKKVAKMNDLSRKCDEVLTLLKEAKMKSKKSLKDLKIINFTNKIKRR